MKKLLAIAGSLLALAIVTELLLRIGLGLGTPVIFELNSSYGYFPAPNQRITRFRAHVETNHAGMRSPEFQDVKKPGLHRLLIVGDSIPFGPTFVDQASIFPVVLPKDLADDRVGNWEVLNASAPGWGTANELAFLKSRGIFDSDVVALIVNTGDLNQRFATCNGGNCPTARPPLALDEALERYLLPRIGLAAGPAPDPGSTGKADDSIPVNDVVQNICKIQQLVQLNGAGFFLVYIPAHGGVWQSAHFRAAKSVLDRSAEANHLNFLDLTSWLATRPIKEITFDGLHLRPQGHSIVASRIAQYMETNQYLIAAKNLAGT